MTVDSPADVRSLRPSSTDYITRVGLGLGMAVPFLYYGTQIVAAPYFSDESLSHRHDCTTRSDDTDHVGNYRA